MASWASEPLADDRRALAGPPPVSAAPVIARLQFDARRGAVGLEAIRLELLQHLAPFELTARCVYALELVLEEWLSNVMRHGTSAGEAPAVDIQVRVLPQDVELRFEDRQQPFDPLRQPPPQHPASLDDARPGGLGLELIRTQTSVLRHERAGDRNVLLACVPRHARVADA